jgi:hypothetical protein
MTASVVDEVLAGRREEDGGSASRRLVMAWQHPQRRLISPVGMLDIETERYRFRYLRRAMTTTDFRPFLGFREFEHTYLSDELFPLFQQRVMNPRRPDYERYIRSLSLPSDATPWEQLARSGGKRTGDTIQLFPEPIVRVDDSSRCCFLVHGVRHIESSYNQSVQQRINDLHKGDSLQLVPEPDNVVNPETLLTSTGGGDLLGWVPDLLLDYVHTLRQSSPVTLRVKHTNGPDVAYQFRLIACIEGRVPAGYQPFAGPGWEFV